MQEVITMPDFDERTFLEYISLAAREPIYSAAFAWVLGEQSPLCLTHRLAVIAAPIGSESVKGQSIVATTEWNDIDLLLAVASGAGPIYIAIENKLKAAEGKSQLAVYDQRLASLPGTVKKVYLTLTGEPTRSPSDWRPASYAVLLDVLRAQPSSSQYVADLCSTIDRLVAASVAVRADGGGLASAAFGDEDAPDVNELTSYVVEMRLQKVMQRIWMTNLSQAMGVQLPWSISIDETHGQALLNVEAALQDHPGCVIGLQLQWRALKAFCAPNPYPRVATAEQHRTVAAVLARIHSALALDNGVTPTPPRTRGFRSFRVAVLPPGRMLEEWVELVKPCIQKLMAAFPSVLPLAGAPVPTFDDE
jgi:hypothetical protein